LAWRINAHIAPKSREQTEWVISNGKNPLFYGLFVGGEPDLKSVALTGVPVRVRSAVFSFFRETEHTIPEF
jgi:hypothetical protein